MDKSLFVLQDKLIKQELSYVEKDKMSIAQRLQRIEDGKLYKPRYDTLIEYCQKELDLDRRKVWEMQKVVYRFCEKRKTSNQYSTNYFVKSLFKNYTYTKLVLLIELTEDEITALNIDSSMTWREIHKIVKDFKKGLLGYDLENDDNKNVVSADNVSINADDDNFYKLDKSEMIFDIDGCKISGRKKSVDLQKGFELLKEKIIHDSEYEYVVVKVKKGLGR